MVQFLYERLDDAKRHAAAIERLAAFGNVSPDEVRPIYEQVLAEMLEQARITTYLSIFTARRVEQLLERMARSNSWPDHGDGGTLITA
jgi:DNA-binding transcriptional regulator YdaS (Cro superfamily)